MLHSDLSEKKKNSEHKQYPNNKEQEEERKKLKFSCGTENGKEAPFSS